MALKEFMNHALFANSNSDWAIGDEVTYDELDDGTKNAISSDIKSFLSCSNEKVREILEKQKFSIIESDDPENYPFKVHYFVKYNIEERNKRRDMSDSERAKQFIKDYHVDEKTMDFITHEVSTYNQKLSLILASLSEKKGHETTWRDLNSSIIEQVLDIYNDASINPKNGKIVHL